MIGPTELGKVLAKAILPSLTSADAGKLNGADASTEGLVKHYLKHKI